MRYLVFFLEHLVFRLAYLVFRMVCLVFGILGHKGAEAEAKKLKAGMDSSVSIFGSLNLVFGSLFSVFGSLRWRISYIGWCA